MKQKLGILALAKPTSGGTYFNKISVCTSNNLNCLNQVGSGGLLFNPYDIGDISQKIILMLIDKK